MGSSGCPAVTRWIPAPSNPRASQDAWRMLSIFSRRHPQSQCGSDTCPISTKLRRAISTVGVDCADFQATSCASRAAQVKGTALSAHAPAHNAQAADLKVAQGRISKCAGSQQAIYVGTCTTARCKACLALLQQHFDALLVSSFRVLVPGGHHQLAGLRSISQGCNRLQFAHRPLHWLRRRRQTLRAAGPETGGPVSPMRVALGARPYTARHPVPSPRSPHAVFSRLSPPPD